MVKQNLKNIATEKSILLESHTHTHTHTHNTHEKLILFSYEAK